MFEFAERYAPSYGMDTQNINTRRYVSALIMVIYNWNRSPKVNELARLSQVYSEEGLDGLHRLIASDSSSTEVDSPSLHSGQTTAI